MNTWKDKFVNSLSRSLWETDLISSRIILAMGEFFWAIMLMWDGNTFNRPAYAHMATVMSENMWATVFFLSAITQIVIVVSGNLHGVCARWFAFWNMILWMYTVVAMLLAVYPPPAAGGEIALTISAIWIWIRPYILLEGYRRATQTTIRTT